MIKKKCKSKKEIFAFELDKNTLLFDILLKLKSENYQFSRYRITLISESKYRIIMSEFLADKIVNHFVAKYYLIKYLSPALIDANVATRKAMGGAKGYQLFEKAVNALKLKGKVYCLKLDMKKYFYNIDHGVLLKLINKKIDDPKVIRILKNILETTNDEYINQRIKQIKNYEIKKIKALNINASEKALKIQEIEALPQYQLNKGLPIGNMTSQILAVYYLNEVDHFIKNKLRIKYYIRYMDDLVILHNDKEYLTKIMDVIKAKISEYKLEINKKSQIYDLANGVEFLGYRYIINNNKLIIKYNQQTIKRISKRLKVLKKYDLAKYILSTGSYKGYFQRGTSKLYQNKYKEVCCQMKIKKIYDHYKEEDCDRIILVKEGAFYKAIGVDAIILWHLFDYRIIKEDMVGFPITSLNKVLNVLTDTNINYIIVDENQEGKFKVNNYQNILGLAQTRYERFIKKAQIIELINNSMFSDLAIYDEILEFINDLNP